MFVSENVSGIKILHVENGSMLHTVCRLCILSHFALSKRVIRNYCEKLKSCQPQFAMNKREYDKCLRKFESRFFCKNIRAVLIHLNSFD